MVLKNILFFLFLTLNNFAKEITLEKALTEVKNNNYEIKQVSWGEEIRKGQLQEARSAFFPKLEMTAIVAPMYKITGDVNRSESSYDSWKPYWMVDAQVVFPIFTFGKAHKMKKAANNGVMVAKSETIAKQIEVILKTKEYYYSYQISKTLYGVIVGAKGFLEEAMTQAEQMLKKKDGKVKRQDLLQMKIHYAKVLKYFELAKKGLQITQSAVALQMGIGDEDVKIIDWKLEPVKIDLKSLEYYINLAKEHRPEYKMAKHGMIAMRALKDAKQANHYPNFFLGTQLIYRKTNNVTNQQSAFVRDDYNDFQPGIGIGFQWKWDWGTVNSQIKQAHGELMKVVELNNFAQIAIPVDIRRRYFEVQESLRNVENYSPAVKAAKEWKIIEMSNYTLGIGKTEELLKSIAAEALTQYDYYEAVMELNMAVANLTVAVGQEVSNLKY